MAPIREKDFIKHLHLALFPNVIYIGQTIFPEGKEKDYNLEAYTKTENIPTPISDFTVIGWHGGPHDSAHPTFGKEPYVTIRNKQGCEFDISMDNAFLIFEKCSSNDEAGCIKLQGELVYVWSAHRLFLLPTNTTEYEEIVKRRNALPAGISFLSPQAFVPGKVYVCKDSVNRLYMGMYKDAKKKKKYHFVDYSDFLSFIGEDRSKIYVFTENRRVPTSLKNFCTAQVESVEVAEEDFNAFRAKYEISGLGYSRDPEKTEKVLLTYEEFEEFVRLHRANHHSQIRIFTDVDGYDYVYLNYWNGKYEVIFCTNCPPYKRDHYEADGGKQYFTLRECFDIVNPYYSKCYLTTGEFYMYEHGSNSRTYSFRTPEERIPLALDADYNP